MVTSEQSFDAQLGYSATLLSVSGRMSILSHVDSRRIHICICRDLNVFKIIDICRTLKFKGSSHAP